MHAVQIKQHSIGALGLDRQWLWRLVGACLLAAAGLLALLWADSRAGAQAAPCTTTPAYGDQYTCGIGAAGEVDNFTVTGTTGQELRVRVVETSGNLFAITEIRKGATTICTATGSETITCALTSNGTFTIRVTGNATSTGNYTIQLQNLDAPVGCGTLPANSLKSGNLGAIAEADCFTFVGTSADRWRTRLLETGAFTGIQEIVRPNGTTICAATTTEHNTCLLDTTGTHTIHLTASATATGTYKLYAQKLNAPTGCTTLTAGTNTNASITNVGEIDCYRYNATNGHDWRHRALETVAGPFLIIEILRPDGTTLCTATGSETTTCTATNGGNHTVLIWENSVNTGNYRYSIQNLDAPVGCGTLPANSLKSGNLGAIAEADCFTFVGTSADRWRTRLLETGAFTGIQEIVRPNGTTICAATTTEHNTCLLDTTGTHTIHLTASATATGTYKLYAQKLNAPTGCTTLTAGTNTNASITNVGEIDCYRYNATNGHDWRHRALETVAGPFLIIEILRPDGTTLCTATGSETTTCTATNGGNHTVLIWENSVNTGNYRYSIQNLDAPIGCGTLPANSLKSGNLGAIAEADCFTFVGTSADRWRTRLLETGAFTGIQEIVRPNGTTICAATTTEHNTCLLDTTGTHTIHLTASATATGTYKLYAQKLNAPTGCTTKAANSNTAGNVDVSGKVLCYRYNAGTAADVWRNRLVETIAGPFLIIEILRPDGTTLCTATGSETQDCQSTTSGNHTVLIWENSVNTGPFQLYLQRQNAPLGCTNIAAGSLSSGTVTTIAESDCFKITALTGQRWRIRLLETTSFTGLVEVVRPDGASSCTTTATENSTCSLTADGTHAIFVNGAASGVGNYKLYVQKFSGPAGCVTLTEGVNANGSISTAGEVDCYRIATTNGASLQVSVTEGAGFALQEVLRPDGTTLCGPTGSQTQTCSPNLGGTYTVLVWDNSTATSNYTINADNV